MRVMLVQHMFSDGGIDRVGAHLARGLAEHGFDVTLLVFCRGGEKEAALLPLVGSVAKVHSLGSLGKKRAFDIARLFPAFVAYLRQQRPDCILSTANNMNWVCALGRAAGGLDACRLILKTTNPIVRPDRTGLAEQGRTWGYKRAFAAADAVLALSDAERDQLAQHFPAARAKFRTVANPYVTPAMLAIGRHRATQPIHRTGPARVIAIGRLSAQKRLDRLVEAFAHIPANEAHLHIAGEGEDRPLLEAIIAQHKLSDRVFLPGYVDDVPSLLRTADLMVLTSAYEGLPAVVLEAMAANCPVLSTDCFPSARALLDAANGCGILEDPSPPAIARAIRAQLAHPPAHGLDAIAEQWSITAGIDSHADAVRDVLRARLQAT